VVLGIFIVAVYRLGRSALRAVPHAIIGAAAAGAVAFSPLGTVAILALATGTGLLWFYSRKVGVVVLAVGTILIATFHLAQWSGMSLIALPSQPSMPASPASLVNLTLFFLQVGALTFGGGLTMIAFIQEQVVDQFRWLTPQEFLDGLALGQLTPGPILMVAAYVGYKVAGIAGAAVAAAAIFLPSFILMLSTLPLLTRVRELAWMKAIMQGVGPAVIGVLAVSLVRLAPHALPDLFAIAILLGTLTALLFWRVSTMKLILVGSILGVLRSRLTPLLSVRALL
jgi:chromate transporter